MLSLLLYLLLCVVLYLCYQIYNIPIPKGCSNPGTLRKIHTINLAIGYLGGCLEKLGLVDEVVVKKYILKKLAAVNKQDLSGISAEDTVFAGVKVRVYTPTTAASIRAGMVYYHGGGFTLGDPDTFHQLCSVFSKEANLVVVSVNYRLNPEFSVKDGFDDCVAATKYFINNADKFSVDPNRTCIAGDSAGGNLTSTVAIYLRDITFNPMPKLQILIYPMVQMIDTKLPSFQQHAGGPFMARREYDLFKSIVFMKNTKYMSVFNANAHVPPEVREKYSKTLLNTDQLPPDLLYPPYEPQVSVQENKEVWARMKEVLYDPYHHSLMADSHENLPAAYIFTCEYDMLRDDGFLYARKLKEAKVKVTHRHCPVGWHGMIQFLNAIDDSTNAVNDIVAFLKDNL